MELKDLKGATVVLFVNNGSEFIVIVEKDGKSYLIRHVAKYAEETFIEILEG